MSFDVLAGSSDFGAEAAWFLNGAVSALCIAEQFLNDDIRPGTGLKWRSTSRVAVKQALGRAARLGRIAVHNSKELKCRRMGALIIQPSPKSGSFLRR